MRILNVGGVNLKPADVAQASFVEQPREIRVALLCEPGEDDAFVVDLVSHYLGGRRIRLKATVVEEEEVGA